MNIATVRHLPIPEGESNHTLPYNNGVSLHVGPVRVLGGCAEAEIKTIRVLCVGAIGRTSSARSSARPPDAAKSPHSLVSVDRLPSRARAGRSRRASAAPAAKRDTREGPRGFTPLLLEPKSESLPNFFPIVPQSLSYLLEFPVWVQGERIEGILTPLLDRNG